MHEDGFATPSAGSWTESDVDGAFPRVRSGDVWSDQRLFPSSRFAIVPDPAGSGERVMRFTVPADQSAYRSEIGRAAFSWGRYRYDFSTFVPEDYVPYRYQTILAQWPGLSTGDERPGRPPLVLSLRGAPSPAWEILVNRVAEDGSIDQMKHPLPVPFRAGVWNDWSVDIVWSTPSTPGRVTVSHAGGEVLRIDGVNNAHQKRPPYFQTGIYRSTWRTGGYAPQPDLQIYHRRISVHDLTACPPA